MKRETSRLALNSIRDLGHKQRAVYDAIKRRGIACNLEIADDLRLPINSVTPRTNELVQMRLVQEAKKKRGPTGRLAIYWEIVPEAPKVDWEKMRTDTIRDMHQEEQREQLSFFL